MDIQTKYIQELQRLPTRPNPIFVITCLLVNVKDNIGNLQDKLAQSQTQKLLSFLPQFVGTYIVKTNEMSQQ